MEQNLKNSLNYSLLSRSDFVNNFSRGKINVLIISDVCVKPELCECYKFIIPQTLMPPLIVDGKKYNLEVNKAFPINPHQSYTSIEHNSVFPYSVIYIDRNYLQETACAIFGRSSLYFETGCFEVDLNNAIQLFTKEFKNQQPGHEAIMESLSTYITIHLLRRVNHNLLLQDIDSIEYNDEKCVEIALDFMRDHYADNISLDKIARKVNYSTYHFIRLFKEHTGRTPIEYLINTRIEKAKEMLITTKQSLCDICFSCGFSNRTHFSSTFKVKTGFSPSEYRKLFSR